MNYFLLNCDPHYVDAPVIASWQDKVDPRNICPGKSQRLPDRQILNVLPNAHMVFSDVLSSPFLLLSQICMDVVKIYETHTVSKQMILLDLENRQKQTYYLPILQHATCLAEGSRWSMDKSVLLEGVLDLSKVGDLSIFHLADLKNRYTVIRLDVLESMLKRGARGLGITQLKTAWEGDAS